MTREPSAAEPLIRVRRLSKVYRSRGTEVVALDDVDLDVAAAAILAVVGSSGSGKSTLARCLALLESPSSGEIWFDGVRCSTLGAQQRARLRPRIQLVFQDPAAAISPGWTAFEAIAEPLHFLGGQPRRPQGTALRDRVDELMHEVGLAEDLAERTAGELSGGQRQRVVIARALAAAPRVLILDEGLAALDLSSQARIVNLLLELRGRHRLTYLLISHDLRLAAYLADEIAVLDGGRIVERVAPDELLCRPEHPASRELVSSLGGLDAEAS